MRQIIYSEVSEVNIIGNHERMSHIASPPTPFQNPGSATEYKGSTISSEFRSIQAVI